MLDFGYTGKRRPATRSCSQVTRWLHRKRGDQLQGVAVRSHGNSVPAFESANFVQYSQFLWILFNKMKEGACSNLYVKVSYTLCNSCSWCESKNRERLPNKFSHGTYILAWSDNENTGHWTIDATNTKIIIYLHENNDFPLWKWLFPEHFIPMTAFSLSVTWPSVPPKQIPKFTSKVFAGWLTECISTLFWAYF